MGDTRVFTISADNRIMAYGSRAELPGQAEGELVVFASLEEWASLAAPWPSSRLVAIWNHLPGLVAFWLAKPADQRTDDEQQWVHAIVGSNPQLAAAELLAQRFRQLFKDRDASALSTWVAASSSSQIPEIERFAAGLQRDYAAVTAAVEQPWSNGQVEGQVHRLKLLKRQMYGRSGFRLLRARVLEAKHLTPDVGGKAGAKEFTDAVVEAATRFGPMPFT